MAATTHRGRDDRGDAVVETVLVVPVLLLLIMTIMQFGLWYHAQHTVRAAAQEGVRAARVHDGTAQAGEERAQAFMADAAPTLVQSLTVDATRDLDHARIEVRGTVQSLVPGLDLVVHAVADSPTETFRADVDGRP